MNLRNLIFRTNTGLKPEIADNRDLPVGLIWGFLDKYVPKGISTGLKPREAKNQYRNTCSWNASIGMKELDEKEELSVRGNVIFGKARGYISKDGFATLRNNQKVLLKDGAIPAYMLDENKRISWADYSNKKYITPEMRASAIDRRIKSYLKVNSIPEIYKMLDEGRPVEIGIDWYTGWQGRHFKLPWIVHKIIGWYVGGHALYIYDYDLKYKGQRVFITRNSFGAKYGDNGDFYITEQMLAPNIRRYGAFINYDLDKNILKWLQKMQGVAVQGDGKDVFLIVGDKKRLYPDEATLLSNGKSDMDIVKVDNDILEEVERGEDIDFWSGGQVKAIKEMILRRKNLKQEFEKYFKELF